ncbi:hypothetical protein KEA56_02910 [Treponema pallidum]|nr:hypothetical protein KEA56_02910 [Treponema pallidum]
MEERKNYMDRLAEALTRRKVQLDRDILPKALEQYRVQVTAVKAIRSNLLQKGFLHDDAYKYDSKMTEIELPETSPYGENEKPMVIGSRLSHYQTMLGFLDNYYRFDSEFLIPKRIAKLVALNGTFMWKDFTATTKDANTRGLFDIVQSFYGAADPISIGLVRDSLQYLVKAHEVISTALKSLSVFHRERYKLLIRQHALDGLDETTVDVNNPEVALDAMKKNFSENAKGHPFYSELATVVLREDFSANAEKLRAAILREFEESSAPKRCRGAMRNPHAVLLSGFRSLGATSSHFHTALEKIRFNEELVTQSEATFFSKVVLAFLKAFNIQTRSKDVEIVVVDPATQIQKKECVNVELFQKELARCVKLYRGFVSPDTPIHEKLMALKDEQLFELLFKHVAEAHTLVKQLAGLDEYYKTVRSDVRAKIKGVKVEVTTITTSVTKANKCRAEYASQLEEQKHMKRLGVARA